MEWMGRNHFTTIMGHIGIPSGGTYSRRAKRELRVRRIRREGGGHIIPSLLPKELFEKYPEYFPANRQGDRTPRGNLCPSNPDALKIASEDALKLLGGIDVLHCWGEDVRRGAWCNCEKCYKLPPVEQYLRVVNAVADAVQKASPGAKVAYIAYYDTMEPELESRPANNVLLLCAPRTRCYRHTLDDPKCERNRFHLESFCRYREIFKVVETFEYYGDCYLYCSASASIPWTIGRDIELYHRLGVTRSGCLMFGGASFLLHPVNEYVFVRKSWDVEADIDTIVREFCEAMYSEPDSMYHYLEELQEAIGYLVETMDWRYRAKDFPKLSSAKKALEKLDDLSAELGEMVLSNPDDLNLFLEKSALELTVLNLRSFVFECRGWRRSGRRRRGHFRETQRLLRAFLGSATKIPAEFRGSWCFDGYGELRRISSYHIPNLLNLIKSTKEE